MKNIQELLANKRIGIIDAHPDDHLIQVNAIQAAHAAGGAILHEMTLTKGRRSTLNHTKDPDFVRDGKRELEGHRGASYMGIATSDHLDGTDGALAEEQDQHVPHIVEWADRHGIDLFLTLGGLTDHSDHKSSAVIAKKAASQLWDSNAHAVGILEVQQIGSGPWKARTNSMNQATAFGVARQHASQMQVADTEQPGWDRVPGGLWVHPGTMAGLDQYPIRRNATYLWVPPAMFDGQVIIEQIPGTQ
jgi:LmbE family N-acetylglucosaminyl deacetylase